MVVGKGLGGVSFYELGAWAYEMGDCVSVDPEFAAEYFNTAEEATTIRMLRLEDFIERHHLYDQFIAEDEQGKR